MFYAVDEEEMLIVMVGILLVVYLFLLGVGIAGYIMNSIALQKIASRRLISNAWLAWVPVANSWVIGSIADEYDDKNGIKRKWRVVLLTLSLISIGGIVAGYVGLISSVVSMSMQTDFMNVDHTGVAGMIGMFIGAYVVLLVAAVIASAQGICNTICLYKIFESTVPEKSVKYLLLSLLVPLAKSICLLKCRNKGYSKEIVPVYPTYPETVQEAISEENVAEETVEEANVEEVDSEEL